MRMWSRLCACSLIGLFVVAASARAQVTPAPAAPLAPPTEAGGILMSLFSDRVGREATTAGPLLGLRVDARTATWRALGGRSSVRTVFARSASDFGVSRDAVTIAARGDWRPHPRLGLRTDLGWRGLERATGAAHAEIEATVPIGRRLRLLVGIDELLAGLYGAGGDSTGRAGRDSSSMDSLTSRPDDVMTDGSGERDFGRSALRVGLEGSAFGVDWRASGWNSLWRTSGTIANGPRAVSRGYSLELDRVLSDRFAFAASLATHTRPFPSDGRPRLSVGLRYRLAGFDAVKTIRPDAATVDSASGSPGGLRLRVRAVGARGVEALGDVTDWKVVRLKADSERDWWTLDFAASSGVHRLSVRVDGGEWLAPPGLPIEADEFGGTTGVLRVP